MGQRVKPVPGGPWFTVQGVAQTSKTPGLARRMNRSITSCGATEAEDWQQPHSAALVVKTTLAPTAMAPWIRAQMSAIDPTVPVEIETLNERVSGLADRPRFETALLGFFAGTGLLMAVIGLYGVVAFMARAAHAGDRGAHGAGRGPARHSAADSFAKDCAWWRWAARWAWLRRWRFRACSRPCCFMLDRTIR